MKKIVDAKLYIPITKILCNKIVDSLISCVQYIMQWCHILTGVKIVN